MEFKNIKLEVKEGDDAEAGVIVGYGSIYGNVDRGNDVVIKGAFDESLASGRKIKMLYQHNPHDVIGLWTAVVSDDEGLKVEGQIADTEHAQEVLKLIKMGAIDGLSIGYRTIESHYDENGNRLITKADLWEVSVVTFPMNEAATIVSAKAQSDMADIKALLEARIALLKA